MKKRLLAFVCVLAILAGMFVVPVSAETEELAEGGGYEVGYAKVDVNPWVELKLDEETTIGVLEADMNLTPEEETQYIVTTEIEDPMNPDNTISQKMISVPLAGYGNSLNRLATGFMDDNGDGVVGYGDGVYATCTTVTDANGKTVVYVTIDCIRGSDGMTRDIRNGVVAALGADLIAADQIMLSGSHSHSAPEFYSGKDSKGNITNKVWAAYYDYVIGRIVDAAVKAYTEKSPATMSKGSIEAPVGMSKRGYGEGISLNFVRHAVGDYTLQEYVDNGYWIFENWEWETVDNQELVRTAHSGQMFGERDFNGTKYKSSYTLTGNVSEADETLHVLQFTREEGEPVLLVNWRAHAAMNGGSSDYRISSDYVGSLRSNLEAAGYCAAFWQGASGNINGGQMSGLPTAAWENLDINGLDRAAKYGYLLAEVTLACLDGNMQVCDMGAVKNRQARYNVDRQTFSEGLVAAAQYCYDATGGNLLTDTTIKYPFAYQHTDGETYVLNSDYHANVVYTSVGKTGSVDLELNVITMGENVTLVTLPVEPFDRYSLDATMSDTTDNDWDDLIGESYGTPFVLGYSNDHNGYLANDLSYTYGPAEGSKYSGIYGAGSYESNTSSMAQGAGEAVIAELGNMIEVLSTGYKIADCDACGTKNAQWTPLTHDQLGIDLTNGHYYLAEDITATASLPENMIGLSHQEDLDGDGKKNDVVVDQIETVCFDLNGKTLDYKGQVFRVYANSTLNIMDTYGEGKLIARTDGNVQGGVILADADSTLNLYSGTLQFIKDANYDGNPVGRGGVICSSGTVNMYDGTIIGGEMSIVDPAVLPNYNGVGGAVYVSGGSGAFHMYGGRIQAYTGETADGIVGNCVYVQQSYGVTVKDNCGFWLYNDAVVDEIYVEAQTYSTYRTVVISGQFTGSAAFNLDPGFTLTDGLFVALLKNNADFSDATLRLVNDETYYFRVSDTNSGRLCVSNKVVEAVIDGEEYASLADAIANYTGGEIKLLRDVEGEVVVDATSNAVVDLNGYDIEKLTVAEGLSIICRDSQTDDFTVNDAFGYGVIGSVSGNVATYAVDDNGYLVVGEDTDSDGIADKNVSFHRVDLNLTDMTLRANPDIDSCNPSMYYKSNFAGDEVVADMVKTFGVALSVVEEPNASNMGQTNKYSWFDGANFKAGGNNNDATSTLLYGVMKEENGRMTNTANAVKPVYGRAYIQLTDGSYIFGQSYTGTLKELTEGVNNGWEKYDETQKQSVFQMYKVFNKLMTDWSVAKIKNEFETTENAVLKVLVVGNSHGLDATRMLNEIFKAEAPNQKIVIGALYKSGCTMTEHADFMTNGKANYDYLKNGNFDYANDDGSWLRVNGVTADVALTDECWDYVIMQQMNNYSGLDSFFDEQKFTTVIRYIEKKVEPNPTFLWHMVWANPDDADLMATTAENWTNFHVNYFPSTSNSTVYDRKVLYNKITANVQKYIVNNEGFLSKNYYADVLPSATVIQYALDELGYEQQQMYRDYTHMSNYGRLMVGYLWYMKLMQLYTPETAPTKLETVKVKQIPDVLYVDGDFDFPTLENNVCSFSDDLLNDIAEAVNYALEHPYEMP